MKKAFQVLKDRPKLQIRVTRDSVCAADDCDAPHERTLSTYSFVDPTHLVSRLCSGYLPSVSGMGHSWDCTLNGQRIASISGKGISARVREVTFGKENYVHFVYHSAGD